MKKKQKFRAFNPIFYFLLHLTLIPFLIVKYNIHSKNKRIFKKVKPPYLVIPNHVAKYDPAMVDIYIPSRIHFVMSDSNLRLKLARWIYVKLCRVVPKTKALSDSTTVRTLVQLVRLKRVICIFGEGRATWDGVTHDIYLSTSKLAKLLKIPVIVPLIQGGYLSRPRWAYSMRRGKVIINYKKIFDGPELADMSVEDIHNRLQNELYHDDYQFQRRHGCLYPSKHGAEYVERLLFLCPNCQTAASLYSKGNICSCNKCGFSLRYSATGEFLPSDNKFKQRTLTEWVALQSAVFDKKIESMLRSKSPDEIFQDENVTVKTGFKMDPLQFLLKGTMKMYLDRFEIQNEERTVKYPISEIEGVQVLMANQFEFYHNNISITFGFPELRTSGFKYMYAVQKIAPERAELL